MPSLAKPKRYRCRICHKDYHLLGKKMRCTTCQTFINLINAAMADAEKKLGRSDALHFIWVFTLVVGLFIGLVVVGYCAWLYDTFSIILIYLMLIGSALLVVYIGPKLLVRKKKLPMPAKHR